MGDTINDQHKYWRDYLSDINNFTKFYNLASNNYSSKKLYLDDTINDFIKSIDISQFIFFTSIFSLYLARVDGTEGCILKTTVKDDLNSFLKIEYDEDNSFEQHLNLTAEALDDACRHTNVNIDQYFENVLTYYSIFDLTESDEDIDIKDSVLALNVFEDSLEIVYNEDLFSEEYIDHMIANVNSLIDSVSTDINQQLKDIEIISDEERALISKFCQSKPIDVDNDRTLAMAFRENAMKYPDVIAIDDGVDQITYNDLEKSSNSIAYDLKNNHDLNFRDRVGLLLPRNYHFPEMVLALNKLGVTFIPIDSDYPLKRIEHMLEISQSNCIITTRKYAESYDFNSNLICIEDLNRSFNEDVECVGSGDDLFAILFTSGTTGLPKGVMVSNKQIAGDAASVKDIYTSSPGDVCGCYASFSFIASFRLYYALYFGETCRILNEKEHSDSLLLIETLKKQHFNDLILPPALGLSIFENENLDLKYLLLAGSKIHDLPVKDSGTELINLYGTTEILMSISGVLDAGKDNVPVGKPLGGYWVYVLDKNHKQLPVGVAGEIYVSGDYISQGYYNNPERTEESFIENPYSDSPSNRIMYRTGDIGFYNFEGDIEIVGRSDDQLSVRGFRVESDEILSIMKDFDSIDDVCLDVDNDNLIAYFTTTDNFDLDNLKNSLRDELPSFMVPSLFIELDEIPLNANGKIDKFALRKNIPDRSDVEINDEVLSCVVDAFKEVLKIDFVLIDDDFVSLGGNSLSSMFLQRILKDKLDVNLYVTDILELSTPVNIANHIKFNSDAYSSVDVNYDFNDMCPLSESQLNVYLDEVVNEMGTGYNNPYQINFAKSYGAGEIREAIEKLFEVFPVLSARIINDNGMSYFKFDAKSDITEGDLKDIESFVRPFDLNKSLCRFLIVENQDSVTLSMDFHHLIFDGTSLNVIITKLTDILNGLKTDTVDNGVLRQISFEESLSQDYMDGASEFFNQMLADREDSYELLSPVRDLGCSQYRCQLDVSENDLISFLKDHNITHNQFFASVFAFTLSRFTGSSKALFNLVEDGRGRMDLSDSVGMFVRTLPLLIDCNNQSIESFLNSSSTLVGSAMKYDLYPFRILANEYNLNSNILFQYSHDIFKSLDEFNVTDIAHDLDCDFSFNIFNFEDSFAVKLACSDVYSSEFLKRFSDSFKLILHEMISVDNLCEINYITGEDVELLDTFNQTEKPLVYGDVLDAFNDNLSRRPEAPLVSFMDTDYSYGEGAFIADRIANRLNDMGVESGENVAFLVERSELYMFCILGIMSTGAVYVPLDDKHPDERIRYMVENTGSRVIIASDETYSRADNLLEDGVVLNISDVLKDEIGTLDSLPVVYGDLACILYTSGTTGLPKGVRITRKAVLNFAEFYVNESGMDENSIYGLFASIGFDVAIKGIFSSIYSGACLNVTPEDIKLDMDKLNRHFAKYGVTHTHITTQVAKLFLSSNEDISLTELVTGGEKLGEIENTHDCRFVDTYGPTEACVYVTSINEEDKIDSSSVGHLLNNLKAYVLDENLNRVPCGAVGELFLAGYQIADGYLNREEETRNAFIENPFDDNEDYSVMYRTGDVARFLPDGSIDIIGRRDNQIKVRGNRVELSEIEAVIREIDYIDDVTVQAIKNNNDNEVVAYVVINNKMDDETLTDSISKYVGERKPEYMIPSFVVSLEEIPLNVNGKVDRRALPEVDLGSMRVEYVAPRNDDEKTIVEAFEKVFNQENIGVHDDFARLGGDSLTAIKLISYLNDYNISAADILSLRTPEALAENIKSDDFDLDIYSVEDGCPLNESQLNVYLDIVANEKTDAYLIPLKLNIPNKYSLDKIENALDSMFEIHPILKMRISDEFEMPCLVNGDRPSILINNDVDKDYINKFITEPFDLHDSLSRFLIVENGDKFEFYGVFHHIIFDGLSNSVFKDNLISLLKNQSLTYDDSFLKASAFSKQIQDTPEFAEAEEFYDAMLVDSDEVSELLESVDADGPGVYAKNLTIDLNSFKEFLNKNNINENMLFTSVFAYTLSRFVGSDKVLFNIVENGRSRFDNFDSIGMFVNTLPVMVDCKNREVPSFLNHMSSLVYDVMRYNYYPFRLLANKYDINSNIVFQFIPEWFRKNQEFGDDEFDKFVGEELINDMSDFINDFSVNIIQNGDDYKLSIRYSDKYSYDIIKSFADSFNLILNEILHVNRLSQIDYITEEDIELLDTFNHTEKPLVYGDVLDAFNDNLSRRPEAPLVSFMDTDYSYGEGAFIADRIANRLNDLGIESGENVAFLVERSELYMFCVLGIMSTGAVYVPLDDKHPDERIRYMVENTGSKVIIASDETFKRVDSLVDGCMVLNISDVLKDEIGTLDSLPVVYGDLACILYTSGTTGLPKGVRITRKAILNFAEFYVNESGMDENSIYGLFASIGFDVAIKGIFSSIYSGACLNVTPDDIKLDMNKLNKHFAKYGVTHTHITTQVAKLFLSSNEDISLTELVTGGEKLGEIENTHDCRFVDTYGPTEACVYVTSINEEDKIDSSSVGHLLNNLKAYVLDENLNRVPCGAVGELFLAGYQIADGYLNREEETRKAFIENPFDDNEDYRVMYRTGDVARFLPDGSIDIIGRRDGQVKIRGNRVELSEIESVIREIDYIDDVTVQTIKNGNNNEVVAYVVASQEMEGDALQDSISKYVGERKPEYMVPSFVVRLDEIPVNVNGKVDRRALPEVDLGGLRVEYVAPRNDDEKTIVEAFEKVFNQEKIGIYDDFARLGGDSLTAIRLISHLRDYNISAADILSLRTPSAIADNIKSDDFDWDVYSVDGGCPLNEPQLNVYLDIVANEKTDSYLIHLNMDISKEYSIDNIYNALNELFEVHPILGMCISDEFEVPYLIKGSNPEILVKSEVSDEFLTDAFDLHESLSRFLIVEKYDKFELYCVFHHIIFDAMSNNVFKQNLLSILEGNEVEVDDSFLKVSAYTQQVQNTQDYEDAKTFYDSMLDDLDDVSSLLNCVDSDGPGLAQTSLDLNIEQFKSYLYNLNISENALFTAAFAYTLSRFVGSDKVFFNIIENGRSRFDNMDSIGMYVNTLPMLVDCKNQDVSSFMDYMSDLVYDVMRYNYYPFRILAKEYDIDSSVMFQFLPDWINENEFSNGNENDDNNDLEGIVGSINDLGVDILQKGEKYIMNIVYSDKYSAEFINYFAKTYNSILKEIIDADKLSDINYISDEEIDLLDSYNQTQHDLMYGDVLDAFNHNLSKYPDSNLISMNDNYYSYAEGAFIADKIAKNLVSMGVESGNNVAFIVERSELYMFCVLGIMSTGAVYVPLDDAHPDERIQFILDDTKSKVVICSDKTVNRAESLVSDSDILNISDIIDEDCGTLPKLSVNYSDLACILYTSGTTGVPKGVKITRKAILNLSEFYIREYGMNHEDVYALFASIGFDVAMKAIFPSICSGACLTVIPGDIKLNISEMNNYFIEHGVTHTEISTQVAKLFIDQIEDTSLKVLTTGGEKLGDSAIDEDYRFVDSYGPTEACVDVTCIDVDRKCDDSSIGFLLDNIKAYVLDDELRRVPYGGVGELYLAGNQIADGYLNRDEQTAEAFLDNPFDGDEDYSVMYRTGDMVRVLPDGSLGIVGRRDSQVKIRGNRVELSEVESVIREIDFIEDVTVQTIKHGTNNELVAYVVCSSDIDEISLRNEVREYVNEYKPEYMVPSYVVGLDEIPLTVNGKVDKRALPEVDFDSLRVEYVAATNETERIVVESFEKVFDQKGISLFDDFLRLGGDSIGAIRLISLLEKNNISCTARDILNYKSPYLIAQNVEISESVHYDSVEGEVDLLPIQSYYFDQVNLDYYSQRFVLKSIEYLDLNLLQEAFDELCNVHDMLRATYRYDENNNPIQEIRPVNSHICDVNEIFIKDDPQREMMEILVNSIRSISLKNKLIDVNLVQYDGTSYVFIVLHHLIVDGISWNNILVDLTYIYFRLKAGKEINLVRPYPYNNWVSDVKELVETISDEEKEHWIELNNQLDDSLIKGPSNPFTVNFDLNYDVDNLLRLSEEEYLALAIARAYKKTYGKDIIFNRESYGRDETIANLNRTVGWFTTEYPVPVEVSDGLDNVSLVNDAYNIKRALKDVNNLGLNYGSLIYITNELEFKHCPVTFNFLSNEFVFKNELFESINHYLSTGEKINYGEMEFDSYGISFNVSRVSDNYLFHGSYAGNTYIGDEFEKFIENIKFELEFIANYGTEDDIVCCLSEPQIGIYLDEKVNDKGTAYSTSVIFECGQDKSIDEIEDVIHKIIDKHPVLKGRVLDIDNNPLLICDNDPLIKVVNENDHSKLIKPFDLNESLTRVFIMDNEDGKSVFFNIHHMISDAITCGIIKDELRLAFDGEFNGDVDLGFVQAGCDSFESQFKPEYKTASKFFNEMFADIDEVQYLLEDIDGSLGKVSLPIRGVKDKVESFANKNGITISNLLNAVFAYAYSRFTGSNKVYYNFTENGRHEEYAQNAVSMFVRTIPILVDCNNKKIDEYITGLSDLILESMSNSIYPFRLISHDFDLKYDVAFEYNYDLNDVSDIGDDIEFYDDADRVVEFLCVVNDLDDGYVVGLNHSDKFSQDTAVRFVKVFKEILCQFLEKEELKDINYISEDDIKLLDEYNATEKDLLYSDVLDAFNDNLSKNPNNDFVSMNDNCYSYGEGAFIADRLARELIDLGVESQDNVAFLVERSELYMFCVLGIMSIGGVYVPLDDAHPDERVGYMIEDTRSKVIICSDGTYERAKSLAGDSIILNISEILNEDIGSLSNLPVSYGDLACILYTSGSTGVPKGVKITRKSIVNYVDYYVTKSNMADNDVYALFASIGFDVGAIKSFWVPIYCGASLSIIPNEIRFNIFQLNDYFISNGVSHAHLPTQVLKLFLNEVEDTSLKVLVTGGEKLGEVNFTGDYVFVDSYGPTECCVSVTAIEEKDKIDSSSIGFVFYNLKAYVVDNEFRRVPVGATGELCIAGIQVAEGYLNREEENAKVFVENPFDGDENYNKLYRTGDIVRYLPDGSLGIVGRRDSQVKIRGNRVELLEIESVIRGIDYIDDVTVQTIKNGYNNEVVTYVVVADEIEESILTESVRKYVNERKPDFMVPSFVIPMDEIPLNVNGKVDKRALPEVDFESLRAEYVAPRTETEKHIVEAFKKVFDQEKISIHDDFVRLGGDSLTAIRLLSYFDEYNISAADVLSLRTPLAISKNINENGLDLIQYSLESGCPLNESQLNVYLDIIAKNEDPYHILLNLNIPNEYGLDDLYGALDVMFDVHPILTMRVSDEFDVPYLVKGPKPSVTFESFDEKVIREFMNRSFDLHDGLSRFLIVEDDEGYRLFACFHHLIFDAISSSVFKNHLLDILSGESIDVDTSFLEVSSFNQSIINTEGYEKAGAFYDRMLADSEEAGSLLDSPDSTGYGIHDLELDVNIDEFTEKYSISENILFTGVFAYTLSRYVGSDKVFFNIIENGRSRFDNMDSIGMYVNTLPVLVDCKNQDVSSFMDYMSDLVYDVMRYNYYPFRILAKEHDIDSSVMFQFLPDWIRDNKFSKGNENNEKKVFEGDLGPINDLSVDIIQKGEKYKIHIVYSDKFSAEFINYFAKTYNLILKEIIDADKLSDINYISDEEINLLDSYNQTEHDLMYDDVLDAFNYNLSKNPDNNLVSMNDNCYSYAEGAFIADKIAKQLINYGVESQDYVAFLVERSELYMFCALGIMSMGGVYVPLDDAHPDDRIEYIIDDTQVKVVICSDSTYERVKSLANDSLILNVSDVLKDNIGSLDYLPVIYGDLACILYTSGTTGLPKGVKITRKSIVNLATFYQDKYGIGSDDVYGLFSTIGFDAALLAIVVVLYSGACLSVIPSDIRLDMSKMNEYFFNQNITHTLITSQVGKMFMEAVDDTSLDVLLVGGEKLGEFESPENYMLVDAFGPTEACVFISSIRNSDKIHSSSIGPLSYNTKAYILDDDCRRVSVGAAGELCLAGYQISDGYLNREEETRNAFIANPFDDDEGYDVLYRTGDIVRILPDGSLGIVGRRDGQVKIRGNRVELIEIETVIREIDYIDDVTVQTIKNGSNNEIVAYVVVNADFDEHNLKDSVCDYVYERKPDFMVPSFVIPMDEIPLNVNGKVDKRALPEVDFESLRAEYVAPRTETEKHIVEAFKKVFDQEKISIHDDFVRLGGDSLTAIRLLSYFDDYNISAADVLSLRTPLAISKNINKNGLDLIQYSLESGCPLNESQLNVYLDIIAKNQDSYHILLNLNIPKEYGLDDLYGALDVMFDVHPILTMRVSDEFDVPYLVKGPKPSVTFESFDEKVIREFMNRSFDLHDGLSRFLIVEDDDDGYRLFACFHHLIFDGISSSVFKNHLLDILAGESIDVDTSFLEISSFNQSIINTEGYEKAGAFYDRMLADSEEAGSLLDSPDSTGHGIHDLELDVNIDEFMEKYSKSENILFTSVFAYTLSRYVGSDKVFFNIIENGRSRFDNMDSIGMYVNTLPMLVDCKNQDVSSFMDYMSDLVYNVMRYNYYPFRILAKEYDIDSSVMFQFLPDWIRDNKFSNDNENNEKRNSEGVLAPITDLSVDIIQKGDKYKIHIVYSDKFSAEFINYFAETYNLILKEIIDADKLSDINYISDEEIDLLDSFNQTQHDLIYSDVLDAFNDNLSKYPDSNLVSMNDNYYSYAEGAFIADKIAKKLVSMSVESGDNVAFLVERSELYMFCVLGIMSIGAVYVPLDNAHPDDRLQFILEDTGAKVVIVGDETVDRAKTLVKDSVLLNISDVLKDEIGTLDSLPVVYGDLACILYTSGTTGLPKGVMITRKAVLNFAEFYVNESGMDENSIYGLFASIGFDVAIKGIFSSIYSGACLNVTPEDIKLDMGKLNKHFAKYGVTHTHITTQVAKLFLTSNEDISLTELVTGGEKLGEIENTHDCRFVDTYGPTEACVYVTSINEEDKIDSSSVGHLLNNLKAYVLDENLNRVPCGAVGELFLAGYQIADGYLNREEETRKAFLENPFDDNEDYSVMYRTGDVARFLPDGSIDIIGRRDNQVKVRGNRVELSEIEAVIREIDYIEDVTVQTIKRGTNNELVAYVVCSSDIDEISLRNEVREYVNEYKPEYMIPSYVVGLDEIPLTVNGKVDKRALPEVDVDSLRGEYVAPENDVEAFFAKCFEDILGIDNVSVMDNFFDLGGDSLLLIKVIMESLNNGYQINYGDLFDNPTPRLLSKLVLSKEDGETTKEDDYDYKMIDSLLMRNNYDSLIHGKQAESLGNVLLTGSTGFLGIHLLYELLENEKGMVYCLIRSSSNQSSEERLKSTWDYYFDEDISKFENRLCVIEGDVTNSEDFDKFNSYEINTVINSAANVKHFAKGSELKDINLGGTINGLEFAKANNVKFVQVSTVSVAGERVDNVPPKDVKLYETDLFINQNIDNKYVESKFLAEREVLQAAAEDGLDVKIMRVGNLMARSYDGQFQINYETNAFVNNLKAFVAVGKIPSTRADLNVKFSAIDITAKSIIELSKTPEDCRIFHPYSDKFATYQDIVDVFTQLDLNIEFCSQESFDETLDEIMKDKSKQDAISTLLTYANRSEVKREMISYDNEYTVKSLSELGIEWPEITQKYLYDFIRSLADLKFFEI